MNQTFVSPSPDTYAQFEAIYGIGKREEEEFTDWLCNWDGGPAVGDHPYVRQLMAIDLGLN
jgi:hypothetical protein